VVVVVVVVVAAAEAVGEGEAAKAPSWLVAICIFHSMFPVLLLYTDCDCYCFLTHAYDAHTRSRMYLIPCIY